MSAWLKKGLTAALFMTAAGLYGCGSGPIDNTPSGPHALFTVFYDTDGLANSYINDLAVDYSRNGLWIATWGGISFYSFRDSSFTTYGAASDIPNTRVTSLAINRGTVWAGTISGVSTFADSAWDSLPDMSVLANTFINTIAVMTDNSLWFGTRGGVSRMTSAGSWSSFSITNGLSANNVTSAASDAGGKIWVGTFYGVNVFDGAHWSSLENTPPGAAVQAIYRDSSGTMWVGTANGIASFQGNSVTLWNTSKGLPSNGINEFAEDFNHVLWVATDTGAAFFTGTGWTKLPLPDVAAGIPVNTVTSDSKTLSLWFGTNIGLVRYQVK
ncbi:MAG: two-component regulator propeller domain-containing protein [Candidatus Latescibacter sp.]|nr:two-component regulator propeller domain-containing protein [Candidatus Latescibacter sp.]